MSFVSNFFDACKFGCEGTEGYRKSTDLQKFTAILRELGALGFIDPDRTVFADLGCADGRVNVLCSYFVKTSIGIEIDPQILGEFQSRMKQLRGLMEKASLLLPPENIHLFNGSSLDPATYEHIRESSGVGFKDIDIFYTYITLHDLFGEKVASEARSGAFYLVYGFHKVLPRYEGLEIVVPDVAGQGIAALYQKK